MARAHCPRQNAPVFKAGQKIEHAIHGFGVIADVNPDDERGKPYLVKFDNGEVLVPPL